MKSIYGILFFIFLFSGCKNQDITLPQKQELFRYIEDRKEILIPANNRIWIKTEASPAYFKERYPEIEEFADTTTNLYGTYIKPSKDIFNLLNKLSLDPEVIYVSPFLLTGKGQEFGGLTNMIIVRLKEGKSGEDLYKAFDKYEIKEYKQNEFAPTHYTVTLKAKNAIQSLLIANEVHENADCFEYVEVNYLLIIGGIGGPGPVI